MVAVIDFIEELLYSKNHIGSWNMSSGNDWGRLDMSYKLAKRVEDDIVALARKCELKQAILFGSRARGDNRERSDIDLAIRGGNTAKFIASADDEIYTLLMFDIVDLGKPVEAELLKEIRRDGVMLYEEI